MLFISAPALGFLEIVSAGRPTKGSGEPFFDAGFGTLATPATMDRASPGIELFIAGNTANPGSRRTRRRRARYRVGCEGRIAHRKREYGADRSRLKGTRGARIWTGWAVFAYDLDTAAALPIGTG